METAKVDIRKLQLLNDRISQCIDALNQVRLSVHGLTVSPAGTASPAFGYGGYGQSPFGVPGFGLSHSAPIGNPFAQAGMAGGVNQGVNPLLASTAFGQVPISGNPYFQQLAGGLSHSVGGLSPATGFSQGINPASFSQGINPASGWFGNEAVNDPLLTARIAQTFPYAQFPVPPVVTIY